MIVPRIVGFALTLTTLIAVQGRIAVAAGPPTRPNVLLVLTDDQRGDTIRALGNPEIETPVQDALVDRGFVFSNAYCQGSMIPAVCAPSRTMLLTGKSLFRIPSPNARSYDGPTLGGTFAAHGYATLCVSKPGNSFRVGHDQFAKVVAIPHSGASTSRKCADAAIEWVGTQQADQPLFVYLAPSMPHDPRTAPAETQAKYNPAKLRLSKNFMPRHPFDNGELAVRDELLAPFPRTPEEMRRHLAEYYACVTELDHQVGRVVEALKTAGRWDNTVVVFTSDQGLAVGGRHGLMGKQNLYEHVKPPLILAGPGIPKGRSAALVYLYDLFPTLCGLTGVPLPAGLDGQSLVPVIRGEQARVRDALFLAYRDVQRAARDERWKLIWYPQANQIQLFDLSVDPDELTNLAGDPSHAPELERLSTLLRGWQREVANVAPGSPLKTP
ncbi:sulfatase-like hydrolase/transferase [Singulisphaera acidiphila]|uniref:Arylsulfatase A family protein n=1 Tax=Singulisphaera acidiphila (strain ATCC BAA-1392 / DSM 18658 / VKM B-2454 / MOB10) TaxID=886293 RepID=L0D6W9_SINAD|nr:sulfatase-like hydrolase/transferase [Singulisphaera acidiphila]AGA25154.1 arylsulfatase A family protein [Singulisphaera acidiphila DSM 18658]